MKEGTQLTQPQRKALVDMIAMGYDSDIWQRAKSQYENTRSSLYDSFVREYSEKTPAVKALSGRILQFRAEVHKAEQLLQAAKVDLDGAKEKLDAYGLQVTDSGEFSLTYDAPKSVKESIDKRIDKELGTKAKVLVMPFEKARLKLLTVATAEEAEQVVEPLLNFEVKAS